MSTEEQKDKIKKSKEILDKVQKVLEDEDVMSNLCKLQDDLIQEYMQQLQKIQTLQFFLEEKCIRINSQTKIKIMDRGIQLLCFGVISENGVEVKKKHIEDQIKAMYVDLEERKLKDILKTRLVAVLRKADISAANDESLLVQYEDALAVSEYG